MNGFLLSALAKRFGDAELEAFQRSHPHAWLVWEPGPWLPASVGKTQHAVSVERAAGGAGEALCVALTLPKGKGLLALGRDPDCELPINDGTLSRRHLALAPGPGGGWALADLGSTNGTQLNGSAVLPRLPRALREGDRIHAGGVYLTYQEAPGLLLRLRSAR